MQLEEMVKQKQIEMELNNSQFAKYLGMNRAWVVKFFSKTSDKRPLRPISIFKLHNRLNIPIEVMEEYNEMVLNERESNN